MGSQTNESEKSNILNFKGKEEDKNTTEKYIEEKNNTNNYRNEGEVRKEDIPSTLQDKFENSENSIARKTASDMTTMDNIDSSSKNLLKTRNDIVKSDNDDNDANEVEEDLTCGIWNFRPKWIQSWATSKVFLFFFSFTGVIQGMFFAYRMGVLSTLEKRYAYDSRISGAIVMVEEVTPVFLGALLGYFGSKGHRSRVIAVGMFGSVFCSYICAVPYLIYGSTADFSSLAVEKKATEDMCAIESKTDFCNDEGKPAKLSVVLIFMLASFFQGFGTIAYHAVGVPYLDDITKKTNMPLYLAVTHALRILGPVFGFLMSSIFLKYYENPFVDPGFGPEDPRWVGAWWLGFVVQGTLLFVFTIPMLFFPRTLPGQKKVQKKSSKKETLKSHLQGFFSALKRLGKNFLVIFLWLNIVISVYGGIGHFMMLPRYMEQQFRLSAGNASLYSAPPGLIANILSQVLGGIFIWKFQPSIKKIIIGIIILEFFSCAACLLLLIPQCESIDLSNNGYNSDGLILENECNLNCNCSITSFTPVCGSDGRTTYFSPCFAGCKESFSLEDNKKVYTNCSCAIGSGADEVNDFVTGGYCFQEGCWSQAMLYVTMLPIFQFMTHFLKVAYTMILLRSIAPEDKSVCVGTFEMLLCLFGYIPQPVVNGALLDSACIIWEKSCGTTGNCWFYDLDKFNYLMHGLSAFFQTIAASWFFGIYYYRHRLRDLYIDDEDEKDAKISSSKLKVGGDVNLTEM